MTYDENKDLMEVFLKICDIIKVNEEAIQSLINIEVTKINLIKQKSESGIFDLNTALKILNEESKTLDSLITYQSFFLKKLNILKDIFESRINNSDDFK